MPGLDDVDLSLNITKRGELERLEAAQRRLLQLRIATAGVAEGARPGPGICVVMEGWDAAGKGGAIKRLTGKLDQRHYRVASFSKPTAIEKAHTFLWRFYPHLPGRGQMTIFDRSWYGRVLVERVEGFASADEWRRAYDEICHFERSLTADGVIVAKFWLHISHDEQLRRFESRQADPLRSWKMHPEDWRNREKRSPYEQAVTEMLERTDADLAPWHLVAAESKRYARITVLETVIAAVEAGMHRADCPVPAPLGPPPD